LPDGFFSNQKSNFGQILAGLWWEMYIYFRAIWNIYGYLAYFMTIWYILCSFDTFVPVLVSWKIWQPWFCVKHSISCFPSQKHDFYFHLPFQRWNIILRAFHQEAKINC
jgi:hypothetical protein